MHEAIKTIMTLLFVSVLVSTCVANLPKQEMPKIEIEKSK